MYSFWQRPLTWLFFIALASLYTVAWATNYQANWSSDLIAGCVLIAGGWLALGEAHRLTRAAIFVAAILAAVAPDVLWGGSTFNVWRYVLGSLIFVAGSAAVGSWLSMWTLRLVRREQGPRSTDWQYPLIELFGWTIVVAVATLTFKAATFTHLETQGIALGIAALAAGAMMALFLDEGTVHSPFSAAAGALILLTVISAAFMVVVEIVPGVTAEVGAFSLLPAYGLVAAWVLVQRLDAHRGAAAPTDAEAAVADDVVAKPKLFAPPDSDDQHAG